MNLITKISAVGILSSAVFFASQAQAQETNFSYTQLSIAAVVTNFDDDLRLLSGPNSVDVYSDIGGAALSGSYQFDNNVILGLSGSYQENSGGNTELSLGQSLWFVGYAFPMMPSVDIVVSGGLAYAEIEACEYWYGCNSVDDTGLYLSGGVRAWATSWLELNAAVSHVNFDDFDSATAFQVGAAGWFNDSSSVFLDLGVEDDANSAALGYRYTF